MKDLGSMAAVLENLLGRKLAEPPAHVLSEAFRTQG